MEWGFLFSSRRHKKRGIAVNFLPDPYFLLKIKQIKTIG
jgi:hypothetical protein